LSEHKSTGDFWAENAYEDADTILVIPEFRMLEKAECCDLST